MPCHMVKSVCLSPLQHKENRELSERLGGQEKAQAGERERLGREVERLRTAEEEARGKAERVPSLLEQLSFLRQELETTRGEKEAVEEQAKTYKQKMEQVGRSHLSLVYDSTPQSLGQPVCSHANYLYLDHLSSCSTKL